MEWHSWMAFPAVIVSLCFVAAMYARGFRLGGRQKSIESVATVATVTNAILRSWALYALEEHIAGLPVQVEMTWPDDNFTWLQDAVIVVKDGFKETGYKVILQEHLDKGRRGGWQTRATFTFELAD